MTVSDARAPTFENALAFAQDLIRIPGLSGNEGSVADRVLQEMGQLGLDDVRRDEVGNVIGVVRGVGGAPPVLLNCHLDVVAEGAHEDWEWPPFDGVVADGFLHGRGAMDIKGPLALQTYVAASMAGEAQGDIIVCHTVFEERGGLGMKRVMEGATFAPGAVVIGEATGGDVCIGHRGRGEIEIVLHGVAGHASVPDRARNALDLVPGALQAVQDLASSQAEDPVLGPATLVATSVEVLPESRNVIPDQVVITIDWRVLPGATHEDLVRTIRQAVEARLPEETDGLSVEVRVATERQATYTGQHETRDLFTPGFLIDAGDPIPQAAAEAVGIRAGKGPARLRPWGFATDGGWTCGVHGVPTIGFAPGEERFAHTNRERLDVEEARWAFSRYPHLIHALHRTLGD